MHLQSEWFKKQLLLGDQLAQLQNDYLKNLRDVMVFSQLKDHLILHQVQEKGSPPVIVSLNKSNRYILSHCALRAFYGEQLFEVESRFAKIYQR